jgi:dextranase
MTDQRDVRPFENVRAFYRTGEPISVGALPPGTARIVALLACGNVFEARPDGRAEFTDLDAGTYAIQAVDGSGALLSEEFTTVGAHQGERPVHGFATSFGDDDVAAVLDWHRALRSTVVQIYDWMASYTEPLGPESGWEDPSHRPVSFEALRSLSAGLRELGAIAHAYAPVYAVGNAFAAAHPELLMYEGDGDAIRFLDQIVLADPGNPDWQRHFVSAYGAAAQRIGFEGFHLDTYGYPRVAYTAAGDPIDMRLAYASFLYFVRTARPTDLVSFNQVNGVPNAGPVAAEPSFRYCEIWPPNDRWRHFEGLLDRSAGIAATPFDATVRGSIACYPPVWGIDDPGGPVAADGRQASLRTVVLTEAIATSLGASALIYGDKAAALCDPYYPKHARLTAEEADTVLAWRRFALRCRDLFLEGEDTSWYEIGDENGSVAVESPAPVSPEPVGGAVFARVVQHDRCTAVSVVDLTGSANGSWSEPTAQGTVSSVTVRVLLGHPRKWRAEAAVLGLAGDRFAPIQSREVAHRQGRALEMTLPLVGGWSVLRLRPILGG